MLPVVGFVLGTLRIGHTGAQESCPVCERAIRPGDDRVHLPRGGFVHRGCATYRMRRHERTVRTLGSM
jgi:hypothetical protein